MFKNKDELISHLINSGKISNVQGNSNMSLAKNKAKELYDFLVEEIKYQYGIYHPKKYIRTYNLLKSIRISEPKVVNGIIEIYIYFDKVLALHKSVMGSKYPMGYVPSLYNDGWDWGSRKGVDIERFSHSQGTHFIDKAVEKFNKQNESVVAKLIKG